jgi:tRNA threonylcarbamoyl adenosine modification protein YeaZ
MQLTIETSTDTASLVLTENEKVFAELTWYCGQNHTVELLPNLTYLLKIARTDLQAIKGIIIARGPGSFNGLRVGVSTAKGLAFSLKVPIIGVSTLEATAYQYSETDLPICPIFNAGRSQIATSTYQRQNNEWRQLVAEHIDTLENLFSTITTKTFFCGDLTSSVITRIKKLGHKTASISLATRPRRAGFLAELGQVRLAAGDNDDPIKLQPIYLRRPPITKRKHK